MEIKDLNNIDPGMLLKAFNRSFSDYLVPLQLSLEQLKFKLLSDRADMSLSVGAFEKDQLIGFILHGMQVVDGKKVIYNGGTGVIPEYRSQGILNKMYAYILPKLSEIHADHLVLEVIAGNAKAIKAYEKLNFTNIRKLLCYKGHISVQSTTADISLKQIDIPDWDLIQSFWDFKPTWQNSNKVMEQVLERCVFLGAYLQSEIIGYIIYNPSSNRIHQFAVDKNFRRKGVGTKLFEAIANKSTDNISIINVEDGVSGTDSFLKKMGLGVFTEQYEMKRKLD
jgi:ribosomal protein S18 acetylase RimI-like enzyme